MGYFKDIANNIGNTIENYSLSSWHRLIEEANMGIEGLTRAYTLGEKKVSILNSNLTYIKDSHRVVINEETPEDFKDRVRFTFYEDVPEKPRLVDPHSDGYREEVMSDGGFRLTKEFVDGQKTFISEDIGLTNKVYQEHQIDSQPKNGEELRGRGGLIERPYYDTIEGKNLDSLVGKTNQWFRSASNDYISKRFKTVISRFHTSNEDGDIEELKNGMSDTAMSVKYGLSHGRNLLKTDKNDKSKVGIDPEAPYDNPYCRVWTFHHQYNRYVQDTIRPFITENENKSIQSTLGTKYNWNTLRSSGGLNEMTGGDRLGKYGTMYDNDGKGVGLVNITPKKGINGSIKGSEGVDITRCMFSIENLAWKGMFNDYSNEMEEYGLSIDQKGPFGGRIMWFPPYNLKFSESASAEWQTNTFIGRGEPIYTYSNSNRTGTLDFTMLIDHPSVLDYWDRRNEIGNSANSQTDDIESKEQTMLRFFAGCDILTPNPPEEATIPEEELQTPPPIPPVNPEDEMIQFLVFYPNNYSGEDENDFQQTVNPIHYLMAGVGSQRRWYSDSSMKEGGYVGDFAVDFNGCEVDGKTYGGYELRGNNSTQGQDGFGISTIETQTTTNAIHDVNINGNTVKLMKYISDETHKSTNPKCEDKWSDKKKKAWHKKRYYYRADKGTLNQLLIGDANDGAVSYIDKTSYQFNGTGVESAAIGLDMPDEYINKTYSLAEMFTVLEGGEHADYSGEFCRPGKEEELRKILNENKSRITQIRFKGIASSQANNASEAVNTARNNDLAFHRAQTVRNWLKNHLGDEVDADKYFANEEYKFETNKNYKQDDSNERQAKLTRCCIVQIYYKTTETEDPSKGNVHIDENGKVEDNATSVDNTNKTKRSGFDNQDLKKQKAKDKAEEKKIKAKYKNPRYDDEYRFFDKIKENDPVLRNLLSERVKYFDPAFHSMSPEGFNARLTFLHQCTRQGPTISACDSMNENATNLAFGRPPVCILRVGDFYNTRIIIESVNITYDPLMWDLNDEGIGVMPMIANISISFKFIGGSELAGPIERLQNALSFNYYANTSVYDNRAEQVEYENGSMGKISAFKPYLGQLTNFIE